MTIVIPLTLTYEFLTNQLYHYMKENSIFYQRDILYTSVRAARLMYENDVTKEPLRS